MLEPYLVGSKAEVGKVMARLKVFATEVIRWNRTGSNIMGKNDESRIVARHLAESLVPARILKESGLDSWLDFGSGAGFPAIPLAIVGVGTSWLLVESRRQKSLFLRKMVKSLELGHVEVVLSRLETLEGDRRGFDGFTSRATEGLDQTLDLAAQRVRVGGQAFLWRAGSRSAELLQTAPWVEHWTVGRVTKIPESLAEVAEFTRRESQ
jgi:16S rRNA (guanine527-N7)-methyltransferase